MANISGVPSPKFWGTKNWVETKIFDFRWAAIFLFGNLLHKTQNDYIS